MVSFLSSNAMSSFDKVSCFIAENIKHTIKGDKTKIHPEFSVDMAQTLSLDYEHVESKHSIVRVGGGNIYITIVYKGVHISVRTTQNIIDQYPYQIVQLHLTFDTEHYDIFDNFVKEAELYYEKFILNIKEDANKIDMYNIMIDCNYWKKNNQRTKRSLSSVFIPKKDKEAIVNDLDTFLDPITKNKYEKFGIQYKRVYLLEGIPGGGKSSLAIALASHINYGICIMSFSPKTTDSDFYNIVREIPEKCIMIIEDIDCLFQSRKSQDAEKCGITFASLLNILDGLSTPDNFICFLTTNFKGTFDKALARPGRIDYILSFDYMQKESVYEMYKSYMENSDADCKAFYQAISPLKIKISPALLQSYLFKYINNESGAIGNVNHLKIIYDVSNTQKDADETGLFS